VGSLLRIQCSRLAPRWLDFHLTSVKMSESKNSNRQKSNASIKDIQDRQTDKQSRQPYRTAGSVYHNNRHSCRTSPPPSALTSGLSPILPQFCSYHLVHPLLHSCSLCLDCLLCRRLRYPRPRSCKDSSERTYTVFRAMTIARSSSRTI
jgi:hypothetical protein